MISATWYENQRLVGDHWMYGIRLELPFETADIGDGKGGFWGHIKSAFKPRRRHLAERLYESAHAHQLEPQVASYVSKRKIEEQSHYRETVIDGLENAPAALQMVLTGGNFGKMLVRVGSDPV